MEEEDYDEEKGLMMDKKRIRRIALECFIAGKNNARDDQFDEYFESAWSES